MQIDQLKYFVTIVEHKTYLEAANILNISQSSLSKKIIALENELDVILFDRSKRSIQLTEAGSIFYQEAHNILANYHQMLNMIQPFTVNGRGTIRLATLPVLGQYGLFSKLQKFKSNYPNLTLSIEELEEEAIITGLKHHIYDLGIIRKEYLNKNDFDYFLVAEDELVALLPIHHPLANHESLELHELKTEDFIFMNKHTGIYTICINACQQANFYPNVVQTARIETILSSVSSGETISLLMKQQLNSFNLENIKIVSIKPSVKSELVIAKPKKKPLRNNQQSLINHLTNP